MPLDDPETAPSEARVLLIGIDRDAQRRIAHLLHDRGYEVRFAASASEGASALRTTGFAFTVVDLSRDGVDAPAALRPLKGQRNDSGPILLFSDPEGPLATLTSVAVEIAWIRSRASVSWSSASASYVAIARANEPSATRKRS